MRAVLGPLRISSEVTSVPPSPGEACGWHTPGACRCDGGDVDDDDCPGCAESATWALTYTLPDNRTGDEFPVRCTSCGAHEASVWREALVGMLIAA